MLSCAQASFNAPGVVDLCVVRVKLSGRSVLAPSTQQGVDQDVQVFARVIAAFDDVSAVAIDPHREVRLDHLVGVKDMRAVGEVSHPECIAVIARPATTNLLVSHSQLATRGARLAEMAVQRGFGNRAAKFLLEEFIDGVRRTIRLLLLQVDGPRNHRLAVLTRLASVFAPLPSQSVNLLLAELANLAPQRGQRDSLPLAVGQHDLLLSTVA